MSEHTHIINTASCKRTDELVDALMAALERIARKDTGGKLCWCGSLWWSTHTEACDQARTALKLAKEAQS